MHNSYKKWLDDGCPEVICQCGCGEKIIVKEHHKYYGILKYITGHRLEETYKKWLKNGKPKIFCQCGCNQEIIVKEFYHKWDGIPKYILGHDRKGENNPNFGKHHTEENKQKMRNAKLGENHPNFNKHLSNETKQKIGDGNRNKIVSEKTKEKMSKNHANVFGNKNSNWKGGISFEPYCEKFNNLLKKEIRNRDNNICQLCNKTKSENEKELNVHHIHYDKENCYPDLITLCTSCNAKVNYNRDYWEEYFMEKLKQRKLLNYFGDK